MKYDLEFLREYPAFLRIVIFLLVLVLLWLPLAAPFYFFISDRNFVSIITLILLYIEFIILIHFWAKLIYRESRPLIRYGLVFNPKNYQNYLKGLLLGLFSLMGLFIIESIFGWVIWQPANPNFFSIILEGFLVALGIGFAEELFFRGWLLDELKRDYNPKIALGINSIIFAGLHFIKPLAEIQRTALQFPGLVLLGLILVISKLAWFPASSNSLRLSPSGWLGLPMGLHGGLVWGYYIINVGQLINYSDTVSEAITGIDKNPLAGVMGLFCLSAIGIFIWYKSLFQKLSQSSEFKP
ncbi:MULTISPECIES: CPBP family intramembrane glutamic endopeptidase [Planktothrix]|uniref:Abortive infection protein n=2 Tax=Planktothrix TaxID=54304 RepID=A0A4P5Z8M6_PLAAG|nr:MULTISPECIES: type II CAAX endopeptidase family protein [Planktothrix]GDZ92378.1 abortive infection protein [Planktothrix agardhii CCAP 1459/11A]CAC5343930.1 Abortive infection protein [Planktothrix rubescens NIVA-CYA 18]CAD5957265.1 Abortive infection protein [Planktothrix rubescens]CAD5981948.1 Abortive infection protein [Planktothrix rubescens NIVA-CYA 18]